MSPRRAGVGAVLAGLLTACYATQKPAFLEQAERSLEDHRRQLNRDMEVRRESLGTLAAALTGCPMERRQAYELDVEQEHSLGRAVAARQLAALGVQPLPPEDPVARYVDQVGQYLALVAEAVGNSSAPDRADRPERILANRPWPLEGYRFQVLPLEEPRILAGPSGTVMISTGLLLELQSEEELAAVLTHEVVHVQRGHGVEVLKALLCHHEARLESSSALGSDGRSLSSHFKGGTGGARSPQERERLGEWSAGAAEEVANLYRDVLPGDFELEADRITVRILLAAGYDARELSGLLRRASRQSLAKQAWLRLHPPPSERLEAVGGQLKRLGSSRSWPATEAITGRTKRFREAMEPLKARAVPQARR